MQDKSVEISVIQKELQPGKVDIVPGGVVEFHPGSPVVPFVMCRHFVDGNAAESTQVITAGRSASDGKGCRNDCGC